MPFLLRISDCGLQNYESRGQGAWSIGKEKMWDMKCGMWDIRIEGFRN
jgi:hypothetical protein